jgi:uncharacterized protein (DUF1786 family)
MDNHSSPFGIQGILAVDIGGGTQDILLWQPGQLMENCFKLVMPAPTVLIAQQIQCHTKLQQAICLTGHTMGGGSNTWAVRQHLKAGLPVYAVPEAALTLHDNLDMVRKMGVQIVTTAPEGMPEIYLQDLDLERLKAAFACFEVELPASVAVAVQDHGFSPHQSNRVVRFRYWQQFLDQGGALREWVGLDPPPFMTRMSAQKISCQQALVLDTGIAAILGALQDERGREWQKAGLTVVNAGNFHTVAALVCDERVLGIYEHHTDLLNPQKLEAHLQAFRIGRLEHVTVFADNGHGCAYAANSQPASGDFSRVLMTGPKRRLLSWPDCHQAAPYGDMMLTGCFGLLCAAGWVFGDRPFAPPLSGQGWQA